MIAIPEPAVALNDMRVEGHIHPSRSIKVRKNDTRQSIISAVATVASRSEGGRLKALVINCHGVPGYLQMGEGFGAPHTGLFTQWRGMIDTILITACRIASRLPDPKFPTKSSDGFLFCQQIAINANCNVIAFLHTQEVPLQAIPNGMIDGFEGRLICWRRDGSVAWTQGYATNTLE